MIEYDAQELLDDASSDEPITFVIQWQTLPDAERLEQMSSMGNRRQLIEAHFQGAKAPILAWLSRYNVATINDLEGTGNTVVTASASIWRNMIDEKKSPLRNDDIVVCPNEEFFTTT